MHIEINIDRHIEFEMSMQIDMQVEMYIEMNMQIERRIEKVGSLCPYPSDLRWNTLRGKEWGGRVAMMRMMMM